MPAVRGIALISVSGSDRSVSGVGVALVMASALLYATYAVRGGELSRRSGPYTLGSQVTAGVARCCFSVAAVDEGLYIPSEAVRRSALTRSPAWAHFSSMPWECRAHPSTIGPVDADAVDGPSLSLPRHGALHVDGSALPVPPKEHLP